MNNKDILMRFLRTITSWSNAELGLLKLCLSCFGICIGLYFHEYLQAWLAYFFAVYIIMAIWALLLWFKKIKRGQ